MATITGLTAERMQEIIDSTIVDADVVGDNLILTKDDGSTINAGSVRGAPGAPGAPASNLGKGAAFPAGATDGDLFVRTDQAGDPLYKFTDGAWAISAGGLSKVTGFPAGPADGDAVIRTDLTGSPIFTYSPEGGWEQMPRMGAQTISAVRATGAALAQTIPVGLAVAGLPTEDYDTDNMHSTVSNTTRVTVNTPGIYVITGYAQLTSAPTAGVHLNLLKNGSVGAAAPFFGLGPMFDTNQGRSLVSTTARLAAGDYIEMQVNNNSGSSVSLDRAHLELTWLGGAGQTVDERGVPAFSGTLSADQSIPGGSVPTKIGFNAEDFDTDNAFDTSNGRFTIKTPGLYRLGVVASYQGSAGNESWVTRLYKNGVRFRDINGDQGVASGSPLNSNSVLVQAAAGDYFEVFVVNLAVAARVAWSGAFGARFEGAMVGSGKTVTPFAKVYPSADIPILSGASQSIAFNSEISDNDNIHDTVTNNYQLVCKTAGVYSVHAALGFNANPGNTLRAILRKTSGGVITNLAEDNPTNANVEITHTVELAVGDYIDLFVINPTAVTQTIGAGSATNHRSSLSMVKIGAPVSGPLGIAVDGGWHTVGGAGEPAYNGLFVQSFRPVQFTKDASGTVRMRGLIQVPNPAPAVGGLIFTLPVGFRPGLIGAYLLSTNASDTQTRVARVAANGDVTAGNSNAWPLGEIIDMSQVVFRGEG